MKGVKNPLVLVMVGEPQPLIERRTLIQEFYMIMWLSGCFVDHSKIISNMRKP